MSAGIDGTSRSDLPTADTGPVYGERLGTPWWWYVVAVGVASILAAEFHLGGFPLTDWIPFGVLVPASLAIVWWIGRSKVEIVGGELRIRGAHLPLTYVTGAVTLDEQTLRRVVGREGDPSAFVQIRPWIPTGVQVWIDDRDDPTPYWVVSSRQSERLVEVIRDAI